MIDFTGCTPPPPEFGESMRDPAGWDLLYADERSRMSRAASIEDVATWSWGTDDSPLHEGVRRGLRNRGVPTDSLGAVPTLPPIGEPAFYIDGAVTRIWFDPRRFYFHLIRPNGSFYDWRLSLRIAMVPAKSTPHLVPSSMPPLQRVSLSDPFALPPDVVFYDTPPVDLEIRELSVPVYHEFEFRTEEQRRRSVDFMAATMRSYSRELTRALPVLGRDGEIEGPSRYTLHRMHPVRSYDFDVRDIDPFHRHF